MSLSLFLKCPQSHDPGGSKGFLVIQPQLVEKDAGYKLHVFIDDQLESLQTHPLEVCNHSHQRPC